MSIPHVGPPCNGIGPPVHRNGPPAARAAGRPPFFDSRLLRMVGDAHLADELGPDGCMALLTVASMENTTCYRRPVEFTNEELAARCGLSVATLKRVRARLVAAGWLDYQLGAVQWRPARYFVTVPPGYTLAPAACSTLPAGQTLSAQPDTQHEEEKTEELSPAATRARSAPGGAPNKPGSAKPRKEAAGPHQECVRSFCDAWRGRYGQEFPSPGRSTGRSSKGLLIASVATPRSSGPRCAATLPPTTGS
jgi:hypothetical protein